MDKKVLQDIANGLNALRESKVEPMGLVLNDRWQWYKYKALPGHPHPGNAGKGYSHPTNLDAFRSAKGEHNSIILDVSADNNRLWDEVTIPIIKACKLNIKDWAMTVARDSDSGKVISIDLTRGGIEPWAEYPDAELQMESIGSESEHEKMRSIRRAEEQSTDIYMQQFTEDRTQTIRLRVSPTESQMLRDAAAEEGKTISQYIRDRVL